MLNEANAVDPLEVYSLNISKKDLEYVIEDDLSLFPNAVAAMGLAEPKRPPSQILDYISNFSVQPEQGSLKENQMEHTSHIINRNLQDNAKLSKAVQNLHTLDAS